MSLANFVADLLIKIIYLFINLQRVTVNWNAINLLSKKRREMANIGDVHGAVQ